MVRRIYFSVAIIISDFTQAVTKVLFTLWSFFIQAVTKVYSPSELFFLTQAVEVYSPCDLFLLRLWQMFIRPVIFFYSGCDKGLFTLWTILPYSGGWSLLTLCSFFTQAVTKVYSPSELSSSLLRLLEFIHPLIFFYSGCDKQVDLLTLWSFFTQAVTSKLIYSPCDLSALFRLWRTF